MEHAQLVQEEPEPSSDLDRVVEEPAADSSAVAPERTAGITATRMHPITLRFPAALEAEFADVYFAQTLGPVRVALLLGVALYGLFGILDTWIAPAHRRELWFIRFAIVCPLALACLAFTYRPAFKRYKQSLTSLLMLVATLGIIAMLAIIPAPGSYLYYGGLLLMIVFLFTLMRLRLPYAAAVTVVSIVIYVAVALLLVRTPGMLLMNNLFFLGSSAIIGFLANYTMEHYARVNFLQRREIEKHTQQLEQKNAQLVAKNRELAQSRAAIARSARRSELIYSALAEALPGTVLDGKYRVDEKIGSGGFGTVYKGEHTLLHHPVAIKVFRPIVGHAALEALDRFRIEGISACRVAHPNAVTVLDFDVSGGSLAYLVMELLQGASLADELRTAGKLAPHRCASIMNAVCSVLAEAHSAGVVHRDIKPSNIFLHHSKGEEIIKVIDFGIAKLTDETRDPALQSATDTGMLVGTPTYMAPERLGNEFYDGRADVYAVGVMMFEALCGRLPFMPSRGGYWPMAMANALDRPPSPRAVEPRVPVQLEAAVMWAMAKEPRDRPTAAELRDELARFLES